MIRPPHRSVTRFFVPLIDVLTLLFCIFLVMPLAKDAREAAARAEERSGEGRVRKLEADLKKLREEHNRLQREKMNDLVKEIAIRELDIDKNDGRLFYRDTSRDFQRVYLKDRPDVELLVKSDRELLNRDWVYVLHFPDDPDSLHPTQGEVDRYMGWFDGLAPLRLPGNIEARRGGRR